MTLHGHVENGAIVFNPPVALPEGATVEVQVVTQSPETSGDVPADDNVPSLLERLQDFVGKFDGLPSDASVNHDHYLYGSPKRQ
jgi:hypothetical protein